MTKARFVGKPKTVQIESRWLEPGEVISEPANMVEALLARPDFEEEKPQPRRTRARRVMSEPKE